MRETTSDPRARPGDVVPRPPLRFAVIGCGAVAAIHHLPALDRSARAVASVLVDADRDRAQALASRHGVAEVRTDYRDIVGLCDAAIVAVPNTLHARVTEDLLARGVHVLVEKPMAISTAECDRMIAAGRQADRRLAVGLEFRFFDGARLVRDLLASGVLGELRGFDLRQGVLPSWPFASDFILRKEAAGGGVLADLGVHVLDLLLWWLGDWAEVDYRDDARGGLESDGEMDLTLQSGLTGKVEVSRTRLLRNTCRIEGERGTLEADIWDPDPKVTLRLGGAEMLLAGRARKPGSEEGPGLEFREAFRRQIDDFVAAVEAGRDPFVPGEEGRRTIRLIEACYARRRPLVQPWDRPAAPERPAPAFDALPPDVIERLAGRRVLVTGGSGGIGGRLVERLVEECGARVRVLVRNIAAAGRPARFPVELARGDVTRAADVLAAAEGCDVIFHCAYGTTGADSQRIRVNLGGTANVVAAAAATGARVIHLSTLMVYGQTGDGDLDETAPRRKFGNAYADSKLAAERLVLAAGQRGVRASVLQPTGVYGPWGIVWTSKVLQALKAGRMILVDGGNGLANMVYVDDLVEAMLLAAVREEAVGEAFLISGAEPVTWRVLYERFGRMLGEEPRTVEMTAAEALAYYQSRRRRMGRLAPLLAGLVKDDRAFRERLFGTREVALLRDWGSRLPDGAQAAIKRVLGGRKAAGASPAPPEPGLPILPMTPEMIRFHGPKTHVRIEKARRLLGYSPRFDLERGMDSTERWARWANLL